MDKGTTFICNSQSDKPLSEELSHQMEECNRNGRWSKVAQCLILNFSLKSLFKRLFIISIYKCTIIFIHVVCV